VNLLLEHEANINARNERQLTPLYLASQNGRFEVVQFLLQHGANPDLPSGGGKTPFRTALANGHRDVAQLLSATQ
jgi:ankyrin repeat protein